MGWGEGRLEEQAPREGPADPEVKDTRGSGPLPRQRLGPGGAHRARAEAAGDPEWAAEGARVALPSGQCRALRGRRPLRPIPAAPRAVASEAESREREGLSQPALWGGGGGRSCGRGPSRPLGLPGANACGEAPTGLLPRRPSSVLRGRPLSAGPEGPGGRGLQKRRLEFGAKSKLGSFRRSRLTSKWGQ